MGWAQKSERTYNDERNQQDPPNPRVYAVTKAGESNFWQPIGAMSQHQDAKGFNLRLDYLPLTDAEIVVRVAGDKQAETAAGAR